MNTNVLSKLKAQVQSTHLQVPVQQNYIQVDSNNQNASMQSSVIDSPSKIIMKTSGNLGNHVQSGGISTIKALTQFSIKKKGSNRIKQQREKVLKTLAERKKTISTFCFKQYEKDEDPFLVPVIKKITDGENQGSMAVSELWSDKNLKKYLTFTNMSDGKYALRSIAKAAGTAKKAKMQQPHQFTSKHERILKAKIETYGSKEQKKKINDQFEDQKNLVDMGYTTNVQQSAFSSSKINTEFVIHFTRDLFHKKTNENQQKDKVIKQSITQPEQFEYNFDLQDISSQQQHTMSQKCSLCKVFLQHSNIYGLPETIYNDKQADIQNYINNEFKKKEQQKLEEERQIQLQQEMLQKQVEEEQKRIEYEKRKQARKELARKQRPSYEQSSFFSGSSLSDENMDEEQQQISEENQSHQKSKNSQSQQKLSQQSISIKVSSQNQIKQKKLSNSQTPKNSNIQIKTESFLNNQRKRSSLISKSHTQIKKMSDFPNCNQLEEQENSLQSHQYSIQQQLNQYNSEQTPKKQNGSSSLPHNRKLSLIHGSEYLSTTVHTPTSQHQGIMQKIDKPIKKKTLSNLNTPASLDSSQIVRQQFAKNYLYNKNRGKQFIIRNSISIDEKAITQIAEEEGTNRIIPKYDSIQESPKNSQEEQLLQINGNQSNNSSQGLSPLQRLSQMNYFSSADKYKENEKLSPAKKIRFIKNKYENPKRRALFDLEKQREKMASSLHKDLKSRFHDLKNIMGELEEFRQDNYHLKKQEISDKISKIDDKLIKRDIQIKSEETYMKNMEKHYQK